MYMYICADVHVCVCVCYTDTYMYTHTHTVACESQEAATTLKFAGDKDGLWEDRSQSVALFGEYGAMQKLHSGRLGYL